MHIESVFAGHVTLCFGVWRVRDKRSMISNGFESIVDPVDLEI